MNLTPEQIKVLDILDAALCQFLNNANDEYDPRVWIPSLKRNFIDLSDAYNECHKAGIMDLTRAVKTADTSQAIRQHSQKGRDNG